MQDGFYFNKTKGLNPLKDEGPIPYEKDKELLFHRYRKIILELEKDGYLDKTRTVNVLSVLRSRLGLPSLCIKSVLERLDVIEEKSDLCIKEDKKNER